MRKAKKGRKTGLFILLCIGVFLASFIGSVIFKLAWQDPRMKKYTVTWSEDIGTVYTDLSYGNGSANKFDLYLPADQGKNPTDLSSIFMQEVLPREIRVRMPVCCSGYALRDTLRQV